MSEKEENITEATWEELQQMEDLTDWERVRNMTEEEIEQNALDDPDAQPLPEESANSSWKETPDDVVTAGSKQWMSHQERYEFVKNRTYSSVEFSRTQNSD